MDIQRLQKEIDEINGMTSLFHFQLYGDDDYSKSSWPYYVWEGVGPYGHTIEVRYSYAYPYSEPKITLTPDVLEKHHKYGDSICYIRPDEWSPGYRASTAIMLAYDYINKYYEGRLDE